MDRQGGRGQRGRGKPQDDRSRRDQQQYRSRDAPGGQQYQPAPTPQQGAWGRRPGTSQQSQPGPSSSQTPYSRPQATQSYYIPKVKGVVKSIGRAAQRATGSRDGAPGPREPAAAESMEVVERGGSGDASSSGAVLGRGAMRGRRVILPELHTRPKSLTTKKGSTGRTVNLQANYFRLLATTDWCLYQYRVDFAPEEDRTQVRKGLLRVHKDILGAYVFDGTVLYTSHRLRENELELWSMRQSDETKIRITIRLVGDLQKSDHHYLQFFNIIMRKCLELLKLQLVGRDFYDAHARIEVREFYLELWPGYLTSIRQHEEHILMCAEISHKVMRQQTLLDILNDCYHRAQGDYKPLFEAQVIGLVVLTGYNNNTYRISDVDFSTTPKSTFKLKSGEEVSYKKYYSDKYQIPITNDSQPMLVTKVKPRDRRAGQEEFIYLVPELCRATGMTDQMRENFHLMKALSEHTRVSPKSRIEKLMAFNRRLRSEPLIVKELRDWNLQLDQNLVNISGRILPEEKIVLAQSRTCGTGQFADWTRELINKAPYNAAKLNNWVVICLGRSKNEVTRFIQMMQECAGGMYCKIAQPRFVELHDDRAGSYSQALEQIMSTSNPELIFCVVTNNRSDRYSAIKKKCIIDRPVPSQVFLAKNLSNKGVKSIATKVWIQINCKLGGSPWSVQLPRINLMVVGFDVCHDPGNKSKDFGAMVASLDQGLTRYFSAVSHHSTGEELSNEFSVNLIKALHTYREINKHLPSHILVYRDGVGEGQIPYVFEHEVEQLKQKLNSFYGEQAVKFAFVVVTKRINTRIFLNGNNPPPGTVVDDVVTNPMRYDFFIIPQSVRQGTVSPCAFNVLDDSTGWSADQMQRITYKLCHMYFNWSGTVRVPAPCQYAHKLAFLIAQFVHKAPSTRMESLLYFL